MTEPHNIGFSFMKFIGFMVFSVSLAQLNMIVSLVVSLIGGVYILRKWYLMEKRNKQ